MWLFGDLWRWAIDDGSVGPLLVASVVSVFAVLLAATALIWTLAGAKAMGAAFARGWRRAWDKDQPPT